MKTLFKKFDITGLAVMLLAFFVAVGFTAAEEVRQAEWYEVEIIDDEEDHESPENQSIGSLIGPNPPTGDCTLTEENILCAIQLTLDDVPAPSTVAAADTTDGVTMGLRRFKDSNDN